MAKDRKPDKFREHLERVSAIVHKWPPWMQTILGGKVHKFEFDPPLDPGIDEYVQVLVRGDVETFESCEGGPGHAYPESTVRFYGDTTTAGLRALAIAIEAKLPVSELRRVWPIIDGEPTGPYWELTFSRKCGAKE